VNGIGASRRPPNPVVGVTVPGWGNGWELPVTDMFDATEIRPGSGREGSNGSLGGSAPGAAPATRSTGDAGAVPTRRQPAAGGSDDRPNVPALPSEQQVEQAAAIVGSIRGNVSRVVHGKRHAIELLLAAVIAEGHVLIEDVPGVGKTMLAKAIAASIGGETRRVQGTPDLLPGDLTGVSVLARDSGQFAFRPGPLFANVVLCDEINRATPKAQAALLEAMEERTVTVDGTTYLLPRPWMVIATQNPVEQEGTYPLPESQLDRFLIRTTMGYPSREDEIRVAAPRTETDPASNLGAVTSPDAVAAMTAMARGVHVATALRGYVVDVVRATRDHPSVRLGVSPRGVQGWIRLAQARAVIAGRTFVTPDDLQSLADAALSHRLILGASARHNGTEAADVIDEALASVAVPSGRRSGR
jgi:MoxR-like ATPase